MNSINKKILIACMLTFGLHTGAQGQRSSPTPPPSTGKPLPPPAQAAVVTANSVVTKGVINAQGTAQANAQAALAQVQSKMQSTSTSTTPSQSINIYDPKITSLTIQQILDGIQKTSKLAYFSGSDGVSLKGTSNGNIIDQNLNTTVTILNDTDAYAKAQKANPKNTMNIYRYFLIPGTQTRAYFNDPSQAGVTVGTAATGTKSLAGTATKSAMGGNTGVTKPVSNQIVATQTSSSNNPPPMVKTAASAAAAAAAAKPAPAQKSRQ